MTKPVVDTHRFMYRNCVLRAFSLSAPTQPIPFVEIDADGSENEIPVGTSVWTNEAGYVFYGEGTQILGALAVAESAIVRVMQGDPLAQRAQFIVKIDASSSQPVTPDRVGTIYSYDGAWSWNPLEGNGYLPDFIKRGEFSPGIWAEGELIVDETTPAMLPIDSWTHSVIFKTGAGSAYAFGRGTGRVGQVITVYNLTRHDITITGFYGTSITLKYGCSCQAVHSDQLWLVDTTASEISYCIQTVGDEGTATIDQQGIQVVKVNSTYRIFITADNTVETTGVIVNEGNRPVQIVPQGIGGSRTVVDAYSCVPFVITGGKLCMPKNENYYSVANIVFNGELQSIGGFNFMIAEANTAGVINLGIGRDAYQFEVRTDPSAITSGMTILLNIRVPKAWFTGRKLDKLRVVIQSSEAGQLIPECTIAVRLTSMDTESFIDTLVTHEVIAPAASIPLFDDAVTVEAE